MKAAPWRVLRSPILHFVLVGAALFGISALWAPSVPDHRPVDRAPIVISAERIRVMQADFAQRWGGQPTPEQLTALIQQTVEEELLYREARALALDFEDRSVRRRLIEKMRVVSDRPARSQAELVEEARALGLEDDVVIRRLLIEKMRLWLAQNPSATPLTEADLQDYLDRHRNAFLQPAARTLSHVFVSARTHGGHLEADAQALLARLRSQSSAPAAALALSDPFPLGLQLPAYTQNRLIARFGKPFAQAVFALPPGAWSSPIASVYGLHLVWVHEALPAQLPPIAAVRQQVVQAVLDERAAAQQARGLARLRTLYEVRVDGREDLSTPGAMLAAERGA